MSPNKDTTCQTHGVWPKGVKISVNKSLDLFIWTWADVLLKTDEADVLLETDETDISFEMIITELCLDLIPWRVRRQLDSEFSHDPS